MAIHIHTKPPQNFAGLKCATVLKWIITLPIKNSKEQFTQGSSLHKRSQFELLHSALGTHWGTVCMLAIDLPARGWLLVGD